MTTRAAIKLLVLQRPLGGRCEHCGRQRAADAHHRLTAAHLGPYVCTNLLAVCRWSHDWIHGHPGESYDNGWLVPSGAGHDFARTPVRLYDGSLVLLEEHYGYQVLEWPS